jgi:hypothetical protein
MAKTAHNKPGTTADQWNRDRSRIHALLGKVKKAQPGYSDDNYRDTILDISASRADSSKDLTPRERQQLIDRLSELAGEEQRHPGAVSRRPYPHRPRNIDHGDRADQLGKIEALLTVGKKPWAYADAIAKRVCKIDKVEWVTTGELYKIIAALTYQAKREGWDLSGAR